MFAYFFCVDEWFGCFPLSSLRRLLFRGLFLKREADKEEKD
jgi:hypothetical protein